MQTMKEIAPEQLNRDPFTMIGKEWMLISAQKDGVVNTMTASWGGVGILWNKHVAFIFVRPQRFTKEFIDASATLSLSFFDEAYRPQLTYLGKISGRDEPKIEKANLHIAHDESTPYFEEANTVMIGKKLFAQELNEESFLETDLITKNYPLKDFHTMYVVEIVKTLKK